MFRADSAPLVITSWSGSVGEAAAGVPVREQRAQPVQPVGQVPEPGQQLRQSLGGPLERRRDPRGGRRRWPRPGRAGPRRPGRLPAGGCWRPARGWRRRSARRHGARPAGRHRGGGRTRRPSSSGSARAGPRVRARWEPDLGREPAVDDEAADPVGEVAVGRRPQRRGADEVSELGGGHPPSRHPPSAELALGDQANQGPPNRNWPWNQAPRRADRSVPPLSVRPRPTYVLPRLGPIAQLRAGRLARRLPQLYVGLFLYGWSMAMMIRSGLGLEPWDVLHQGLARPDR